MMSTGQYRPRKRMVRAPMVESTVQNLFSRPPGSMKVGHE